jgi:hypothetical protein
MRQVSRQYIAAIACIALVASGCSTTTRVWTGDTSVSATLPHIGPGDSVLLIRPDGADLYCRFERVDVEFLYGCRYPVALQDIQELRPRRVDGERRMVLSDLRLGDAVAVTMRSGEVWQFRLDAVEAGTLRGEQVAVAIDQIDRLTVTRVSGARSLGLIAGVATAVATVGFYLLMRQLAGPEE